jgi:hypothetical protein
MRGEAPWRQRASGTRRRGAGFDTNGDGCFEIGKVFGSTSTIDVDLFFPGFAAGALQFDAVQLVDDRRERQSSGTTVGADIDAVEALSSTTAAPEPGTVALLGAGLLGLLGRARTGRARLTSSRAPAPGTTPRTRARRRRG